MSLCSLQRPGPEQARKFWSKQVSLDVNAMKFQEQHFIAVRSNSNTVLYRFQFCFRLALERKWIPFRWSKSLGFLDNVRESSTEEILGSLLKEASIPDLWQYGTNFKCYIALKPMIKLGEKMNLGLLCKTNA